MINYKYCPQCKNDLDLSGEYPYCSHCKLTIFRNSKPCAGVLPIKDGQVLLSKRGIEPYKGDWDIIGGFLKAGELPESGALREVLEETGLSMKITKLLGMYMDKYGPDGDDTLNVFYLAEITGGEMRAQDDVASLEWVKIKDLNDINNGFANTTAALKDLKSLFS
jgi:ADP-ribose pyrophosphatase YjhB (NUDIX family)